MRIERSSNLAGTLPFKHLGRPYVGRSNSIAAVSKPTMVARSQHGVVRKTPRMRSSLENLDRPDNRGIRGVKQALEGPNGRSRTWTTRSTSPLGCRPAGRSRRSDCPFVGLHEHHTSRKNAVPRRSSACPRCWGPVVETGCSPVRPRRRHRKRGLRGRSGNIRELQLDRMVWMAPNPSLTGLTHLARADPLRPGVGRSRAVAGDICSTGRGVGTRHR